MRRRPADIITSAVKDTLKPYLLENGFEAEGTTTFRRSVGETVQTVEIQRSRVGGAQGFVYLNGIIRLPAISELLAGVDSRPRPNSLMFRPHNVDRSRPEAIAITQESDPADIGAVGVRGIDALLGRMNEFTTTADAVDYLSGKKLSLFEGVFAWYLQHDQLDRAQAFVTGLHEYFGAQPRWEKLAKMLDDVAAHISPETPWRTWLDTP